MRKQFDTEEHHIRLNLADSTSPSFFDIFLLEKNSLVQCHGYRVEFHKDELRATDYKKQSSY